VQEKKIYAFGMLRMAGGLSNQPFRVDFVVPVE